MKTKIISFYADIEGKTYYSDCARELKQRLETFNLNYELIELESSGDYMRNCLKKPGFMLSKLEEKNEPLLWMDIDTDFRSPFSNFDNCSHDIGFCSDTGDIEGIKATPIYLNYTQNSINFLKRWNEECLKALNEQRTELDHDIIKYILLPEFNGKIKIKVLSENYMDFYNGKHIKSRLSKNFSTKRIAHKKIREINKYRVNLKKDKFKEE